MIFDSGKKNIDSFCQQNKLLMLLLGIVLTISIVFSSKKVAALSQADSDFVRIVVPGGWESAEEEPLKYDFTALGNKLSLLKEKRINNVVINPGFIPGPEWLTKGHKFDSEITKTGFVEGIEVVAIKPTSVFGEMYKLRYLGHLCAYLKSNFKDVVSTVEVADFGFEEGIFEQETFTQVLLRERYLQEAVVVRRYGFEPKCVAPLPPDMVKLPVNFGRRPIIMAFTQDSFQGPYTTIDYLRKIKSIGINYLRVRASPFSWGGVERKPNVYDFSFLDSHLKILRTLGIKVIIKPGIYDPPPPDWIWDEDPKRESAMRNSEGLYPMSGSDFIPPTGNRKIREYIRRYLEALCKHLKSEFSDVVEYIVVGEFAEGEWCGRLKIWTWDKYSLENYRIFLKKRYENNISRLNQQWNGRYTDFSQAVPPEGYSDTQFFWDWKDWMYQEMAELYRWQSKLVHSYGFKPAVIAHNEESIEPERIYIAHRDSEEILKTLDAELIINVLPIPEYTKGLQLHEGWAPHVNEVVSLYIHSFDGSCTPPETFEFYPPDEYGVTAEQMFQELKECIEAIYPQD